MTSSSSTGVSTCDIGLLIILLQDIIEFALCNSGINNVFIDHLPPSPVLTPSATFARTSKFKVWSKNTVKCQILEEPIREEGATTPTQEDTGSPSDP